MSESIYSIKVGMIKAMMSKIIIFDPCKKHPEFDNDYILEACGLIPLWVWEWITKRESDPGFRDINLIVWLGEQYGMGLYPSPEAEILPTTGIKTFPGDPDDYPLISIETAEGTLFQYEFGMVAIPMLKTGYFVTRMD